jgi:hypothetical protein
MNARRRGRGESSSSKGKRIPEGRLGRQPGNPSCQVRAEWRALRENGSVADWPGMRRDSPSGDAGVRASAPGRNHG